MIHRQWDAYEAACERFEVPLHSVVGNHDVWDEQSQRIWRERYGPLYFSWDHEGCHFVALDSDLVGQMDTIAGEQLAWLKADLERSKDARRTFVLLHKPLWAYEPQQPDRPNQWNRDVHPLLAEYGVDTVFAGHWHEYCFHGPRDGVRYVVTGGAGAELSGYELEGGFFHIVTVDVSDEASRLTVVSHRGELHPDYVTLEKLDALSKRLEVEPVASVPEDGELEIGARLANPVGRPVTALVTWDTEGTSWQAEAQQFDIPAGGTLELSLRARAGEALFPLPQGQIALAEGDKRLCHWPFLQNAMVGVGPFARQWHVVGPFDLGYVDEPLELRLDTEMWPGLERPGWDQALPPEQGEVDLDALFPGKGTAKVSWQPLNAKEDGLVDLETLYGSEDYAVAFAVSYVWSPQAGTYPMTIGSDDSVLVRINGQEVFRHDVQRGPEPDQDSFEAELNEGWNEVFIKLAERWGGWGFYLRVADADRQLEFAPEPPEPVEAGT